MGSRVEPYGQTDIRTESRTGGKKDGHDEAICRSSQFCERDNKEQALSKFLGTKIF